MASAIPQGPTGLGTSGLHLTAQPQAPSGGERPVRPIPGLRHRPAVEPDPAVVAELDRRTKEWARQIDLFPPEWEGDFDGFGTGRAICLCHPDYADMDRLLVAARLLAAENAVDDCYCEDYGGSPEGLGSRLLIAHSALDPFHCVPQYEAAWREGLTADAPLRAYHSAMRHTGSWATPAQADRLRHDLARLHLGYLGEAAWSLDGVVPEVWEYLVMRQFNNFRPCLTLTDLVAGYELPAHLQALPAVQRLTALAGNATTLVNDLYSYTKEKRAKRPHLNLPTVLAHREALCERDAYLKTIEIHNTVMDAFETESAQLHARMPDPVLARYRTGLAAWVSGNHEWHATNHHRYTLPDFWPEEETS